MKAVYRPIVIKCNSLSGLVGICFFSRTISFSKTVLSEALLTWKIENLQQPDTADCVPLHSYC
jgi:hypothetical protein